MTFKMIFTIILLTAVPLELISQSADSVMVLDKLIEEMLQHNSDLQAGLHRWQAITTRAPQSGALPDPILSVEVMNLPVNSLAFDQEMMSGKQLSLMQMFPFPGKQGTRKDIAMTEATIAEQQYLQKKYDLIKDLKETYFELFFIDKAITINHQSSELLKQIAQLAETRYRLGKGLQQDVFKAQLELSNRTDDLLNLQQQRQSLEARINFLLNRDRFSPLPATGELRFIAVEKELTELQVTAEQNSPVMMSLRGMVRQSDQKVKLAKKEYLPDFSIELAYTQREVLQSGEGGTDLVSGMVNMTVPLYFWTKQKKQIQETQLDEQAVIRMQESTRRMLFYELEKVYADLQKNRQRFLLFESRILPQAHQTLQSSLAAYQVDKLEFQALIDNQIGLYEYELQFYRVLSDYHKNLAELDALIGTPVNQPAAGN